MSKIVAVNAGFLGLALVILVWPNEAHAGTARGIVNNSETIWVGMVDRPGDGTSSRVAAVCFDDGPGGTATVWVTLGTTSGLTDDWAIHGDSADTGTGNDTMRLIATNGTTPSGACGSEAGGSWNVLSYNGHILDFFGDGGNDVMNDGGGSNDTWMYGMGGGDQMTQLSSIGYMEGGDGNDTLYGLSSGAGDHLFGDAGADCLWDSTNTFADFDCGNDTGDTRNSGNTGTTGCPNADACCGLC